MPDRLIKAFVEEVNAHKLKVDSIIISMGAEKREHFFTEKAKRNGKSLSKVVSGLAIGIAVEKGLIHPEDYIMDYFQDIEIISEKNKSHLAEAKVKHLLSMSLGHDRSLMLERQYKKLPADTNYISHILNTPIIHTPGTYFVYTNAGTYLLSAIMQKITGITFDKWVQENLLTPMGLEELHWNRSHQGVCMAATGLHLDVEDAHQIGLLLLNEGRQLPLNKQSALGKQLASGQQTVLDQQTKRLVSQEWISTMRQMHIINQDWEKFHNPHNTCIKKLAYGYHIWVCGDGSENYPATHFFGDGADGQQLIICPKEEIVIAIMARMTYDEILEKIICEKLLPMCYY